VPDLTSFFIAEGSEDEPSTLMYMPHPDHPGQHVGYVETGTTLQALVQMAARHAPSEQVTRG